MTTHLNFDNIYIIIHKAYTLFINIKENRRNDSLRILKKGFDSLCIQIQHFTLILIPKSIPFINSYTAESNYSE